MSTLAKRITLVSEFLAAAAIFFSGMAFLADKFYFSKQIDVGASIVSSSPKNLSLLISNHGQVDVAIKRVRIHVPGYEVNNMAEIDEGGKLLIKNTSILLPSGPSFLNSSVVADDNDPAINHSIMSTTNCVISVEYIAAGEKKADILSLNTQCYAASLIDNDAIRK
ncbi:hypothetical protein [Pantoea sp. At-9b]|uniref:hypothetical protein n=1 Tax=Pantoea sp. (strain At-9b) TaxID=592316 RepID=UPI0001B3FEAC|nr:hypothetical protein [Pantoea sp. At-9b]ADU71698.1 conserved hypothetical protein [Pantoea sp. At-9b]